MLFNMFLFEIKLRSKQVSSYVYFAIWFFMTFFSVAARDFGPVGNGKVLLNGPYAIGTYYVLLTSFGSIILAAIFGTSILRDFKEDTYQLIFTRPISKLAYLGGRWAGSLAVSVFIFSGLIFGTVAGSLAPWADHERIAPLNLWWLLQPFLSVVVIQIFFLGSLYFAVAALARRLMVVYLQGVVLFGLYFIGVAIVNIGRSIDTFWPAVFDPLGVVLLQNVTRYWTVAERNTQLLVWSGAFLYNRLLWIGAGLLSVVLTYVLFPMSAEALTAKGAGRRAARRKVQEADEPPVRPQGRLAIPVVHRRFDAAARRTQMASLVKLRFYNIVREIPFWAIVLIMMVLAFLNGYYAGRTRDTAVWPVTYLMVTAVSGSSMLFLLIVATLYTGEVVWRERDTRFEQIHDAVPVPAWIDSLSRLTAVALVELVLVVAVMASGVIMQAIRGYYHFEFGVYFKELFLIDYVNLLSLVLLAFFCHTLINNKFVAHGVVIGTFLIIPVLYRFGIENRLYLIGETSPYTYSDMNGYGHFVPALAWTLVYWTAFGGILAIIAMAFARHGADLGWQSRWRQAQARSWGLLPAFVIALAVFVVSGGIFYYNTHILNEFRTTKNNRERQAQYERTYKQYENIPQPKIGAVDVKVEMYPERRSFSAQGHYTLVNRTSQPISKVHLSCTRESIDDLRFDRAVQPELQDKRLGYWIFRLDPPLAPGDSTRLDFKASYNARGFRDGNERAEFAYNGTFFDADYFPHVGYQRTAELDDPVRRREEKLPLLEEMAPPGDPYYRNVNLFTPDSDWITFRAVVGTSPDQIAMAPGYLQREWTENGRRYFEYNMGGTKIADFYSFLSGRFAVKRDTYKGVKLEIYYNPGHEFNLDRMLQASKKGLDYFGTNFAPYQFQQFRILEYPRYRTFAQSFPNTVPFSEGIGFIQRVQKKDDIDMIYYVTAHELAHQWWGHQLIGSMTLGSNMMSESLAQYSALMIMEKEYGVDNIRKFLKHELDGYLRGRGSETRKERPLSLVFNESYVWYSKGSLAMYALRDYLGEETLNAALRKFLLEHRYAAGPYPNSLEFVQALKDAAPPEMKPLVADLFESIVLFDNRAVSATWTQTPDKKYKVVLTVDSKKLRADGQGLETEIPVNDVIDIGVFSGSERNEKPLYLHKQRITGKQAKFEMIVDEQPSRAGIDPYHKLIDRKPDDNVIAVSKQ